MNKDINAIGKQKPCIFINQTCPQGYQTIEYVYGKVRRIHTPGLFLVFPFITEIRDVYCGLTNCDIKPEDINTNDGFKIQVDASIQYKVIDVDKATHNIVDLHNLLKGKI
jgi:regulator of protease activity HflC (stomatin/prohibitin superfamily)